MVSRFFIFSLLLLGIWLGSGCGTVKVSSARVQLSEGEVFNLFNVIQPALVVREDFEDGNYLDSGKCSGNCPKLVHDKLADSRFIQAVLTKNDKNRNRTELSLNRSVELSKHRDYLISFDVRIHKENKDEFPQSMFFQVHAKNWKEKSEQLKFWQPIVGRVEKGMTGTGFWQSENLRGQNEVRAFEYESDVWCHCLVFFRLSDNEDGTITIFRDGKLEFNEGGANIGSWKYPLYPKFGIYKSKKAQLKSNAKRTIDYDNIEVYDLTELVESEKIPPFVDQIFR